MKILLIADNEENILWDRWSTNGAKLLADVDLILSAGDLSPYYLEFLVTMTNVPLLYIRGNHDGQYDEHPPEGCVNIDEQIFVFRGFRIAGLSGSMKYRNGKDMYTENEMRRKVFRLKRNLRRFEIRNRLKGKESAKQERDHKIDILLTHAPCKGYGDREDLAHTGFSCFNLILEELRPVIHCYGHVHKEYGNFNRMMDHPSGTKLINGCGMFMIEI